MMRPRSRRWLIDAAEGGTYIPAKVTGRTIDDYRRDEDLRLIVERKFDVIGESIVRIRDHDPVTVARITDFQKIIGLRNVLAHAYEDVSAEQMWATIEDSLPRLIAEVRDILADDEPEKR